MLIVTSTERVLRVADDALRPDRQSDEAAEVLVREHLAHLLRRPRPEFGIGGLVELVAATIQGLTARRAAAADSPREHAVALLRALDAWTEPEQIPYGALGAERTTAMRRVLWLDRELDHVDPSSDHGLELALELMAFAPTSTLAFWRARHRAEGLLCRCDALASPLGRRAWRRAAEMIAMVDGHRTLAEAVAAEERLGTEPEVRDEEPDELLRTSWLLLRLERFGDAVALLAECERRDDLDPAQLTLLHGLRAHAFAATGPFDAAIRAAELAAEGRGIGAGIGAAAGIRLLARRGDLAGARSLTATAPGGAMLADLGDTAVRIARATLEVRAGHAELALRELAAVADTMRRVGNVNPASWPWLEPTLEALVQVGDRARATRALEGAAPHAEHWGTPLVMAELHRSRALLANRPEHAERERRAAREHMRRSEAHLERELTAASPVGPGAGAGGADVADAWLGALTPRVREVTLLVGQGLRDREIAERLHLSTRTVNSHVAAALRVLGARSRVDLATLAQRERPR